MNRLQIYSSLRELIGNPDPNDVTNVQLEAMLVPALEWLAVKLDYAIYTDTSFQIQTNQETYLLPDDFGSMICVEWNASRLIPTSIYEWHRDGVNYLSATPGSLKEYAIRGRNLILYPPPTSAVVTTDPFLIIQYIGSAVMMDTQGTPQLSKLDQELLVLRAAVRYCRTHPSEENAFKIREYNAEIEELLPAARDRAQNSIEDYDPAVQVEVDRWRAAR